ncbi:MAG: alpha/beta fold hydrolase [Bdellovibrionota bacterium]
MKRLEFGPNGTPPVLFLHGFPGVRSKQNREIAEKVAGLLGRRAIVLLYEGLGQAAGEFSFERCLVDVEAEFKAITSKSAPIDLVGHSWGGFQAIRLAGLYGSDVRRLVLMSPLLKFFDQAVCERSFADTARDNPSLKLGDVVERAREFVEIGTSHPRGDLLAKIPIHVETTILQAADDQITPGIVSKVASASIRGPLKYEIRETDHSFLLDRDGTIERIAAALV